MACARKRGNWAFEDLEKAVGEVQEGSLSVREAAAKYSIPKGTIHDHASSKVKQGSRPGPAPVLTEDEEEELVKWIIKMAEVGYGQCKQQVCIMVKDKNGRLNPFTDNLPGRDWWHSFLKHHPKLSMCTHRAKSCTPSGINKLYSDFEQFLLLHNLIDKPNQIWNCDESGFLCQKSGKVLTKLGATTVCQASSGKGQITTLACICASGGIIPPMHIFPGIRFSYNPMEGCVQGAYFDNGWITQELFYGWLTKYFVHHITMARPV